jgi:predicted RecB family nuclease
VHRLSDGAGERIIYSASDITNLAGCEWRSVRKIDYLLGLPGAENPPKENDVMLNLAGKAGHAFEERELNRLLKLHGEDHVARLDGKNNPKSIDDWVLRTKETEEALTLGRKVVYQAHLFDGEMAGIIDFLILDEASQTYRVVDTKLAQHVKITALLQLASYHEQLVAAGHKLSPQVSLRLGNGTETFHDVSDIAPTYRRQRQRLQNLIAERRRDPHASTWGDDRYDACGRCTTCDEQIKIHDDVIQVAGIMRTQRRRLRKAGILTLPALAAHDPTVKIDGIPRGTLAKLALQAGMQAKSAGSNAKAPTWDYRNKDLLGRIPKASPGDIFFDFEGNPLDDEDTVTDEQHSNWGIDYLFGVQLPKFVADSPDVDVLNDENFLYYWADNKQQERQAFDDFMIWLLARMKTYPDMHVYHYAAYEKTHLLSLAQRHDIHVEAVDDIVRKNVLVDLYPIVKSALVIGSRSYSIKKLEPLYMSSEEREGVDNAADSVSQYAEYRTTLEQLSWVNDAGREAELRADLDKRKRDIIAYNRYDCRSTLVLRNWLAQLAADEDVELGQIASPEEEFVPKPPPPVYFALRSLIEDVPPEERSPLQQAIALAASAVVYHRNEEKMWWREHFERTSIYDVEDWPEVRDMAILDSDDISVVGEGVGAGAWFKPAGKRTVRRRIRAHLAKVVPGTDLKAPDKLLVAYPLEAIAAERVDVTKPKIPVPLNATHVVLSSIEDMEIIGNVIEFSEVLAQGQQAFGTLPVAFVPSKPLNQESIRMSIELWALGLYNSIVEHGPKIPLSTSDEADTWEPPSTWPPMHALAQSLSDNPLLKIDDHPLWQDAALDILLRRAPRTTVLNSGDEDTTQAVIDALENMDDSYVAVQGPPGTGKTFTGGHVIKHFVDKGWKIGVVSQAHLTVENMLESVVDKGADPQVIVKRPKKGEEEKPQAWDVVAGHPSLVEWFYNQPAGRVVGGTKWTFSHEDFEGDFDLLVIDEAGQYSLADTIACARSTSRILMLGDPQQLSQVTVGTHVEPVDTSALGWIVGENDVIPRDLGFLMRETWRMNDPVREVVSDLAYRGTLTSHDTTNQRELVGVQPGLHLEKVDHTGNSLESIEEADRIAVVVNDLIGKKWSGPKTPGGVDGLPLSQSDIIVVSPYNAQVNLIQSTLNTMGLSGVRVGTVDRFQGREAAVSIVSLAASSQRDVPRGIEFLLERNRLNVAISRAQFAAILVYSPEIEQFVPTSEITLKLLSDFITVVDKGIVLTPLTD